MSPEDFIVKHIMQDVECTSKVRNAVCGRALLIYRRNQFDSIEQLISDARKHLKKLSENEELKDIIKIY